MQRNRFSMASPNRSSRLPLYSRGRLAVIVVFIILLPLQSVASTSPSLQSRSTKAHRKQISKRPSSSGSRPPASHRKSNVYQHHLGGPNTTYYSNIFDVLSFGAKGDGVTDDTQAFQAAWQHACQTESAVFEVPAYFTFVVRPILFSGPCAYNIVFQVDGSIIAPQNPGDWGAGGNLLQWIEFAKLHNMVLQGQGLVDGRGNAWWSQNCKVKGSNGRRTSMPCDSPTAIRFYGSYNVTVQNLRINNSPQTHLKFDSCVQVRVNNISIYSPATSPNTDGIHLQNSQNVEILSSVIQSGDDCVSIQTGTSNLEIHDVVCGLGHGISVGGLGYGKTQACVSNISVHDVTIRDSQNGVRIKTWQGGYGSVKGISFSNINVINISNPIIIDQFYCDAKSCKNQSSAVEVSGITYRNIKGTYMKSSSVHFACSDAIPCTGISIAEVELLPQHGNFVNEPFCWNIYGLSQMPTIPPVRCLQRGAPPRHTQQGGGQNQYSGRDTC